jgi:WD40 repeat protein
MLELRPTLSMPIHQKQIRDLQFSPSQRDVLLTVALDKKAILYNCNGNVTIQTFNTDCPLWSCTWDDVKQYLFYVGCSNGQIIAYDIRNPLTPYGTYLQGGDTSPICKIKYVRPTYRSK